MRTTFRTALILAASAFALVASAGVYDPLAGAVTERLQERELSRREVKTLLAARDRLALPGLLGDELKHARQTITSLRKRFRKDAQFDAAVASLPGPVGDSLLADRERISNLQGLLQGTPAFEKVGKRLERADHALSESAATTNPLRALARLQRVAKQLRRAFPPQPDFQLTDVNPNTVSSQTKISPRDASGYVSAWYFGRAT